MSHIALPAMALQRAAPVFRGRWYSIEYQPDIFSPQRYVIGAAILEEGGPWHARILESTRFFRFVYGQDFSENEYELIRSIIFDLLESKPESDSNEKTISLGSPQIILSKGGSTSGPSADAALTRIFDRIVAIRRDSNKRVFSPMENRDVKKNVLSELRRIANLDFERITVESAQLQVIGGKKYSYDIDLLTSQAAGSIVSAWYSSADRILGNLLRASIDVQSFARIRNIPQIGLYVLKPDEPHGIAARTWSEIEESYAEETEKLEQAGVRVMSSPEASALAQDAYEWLTNPQH